MGQLVQVERKTQMVAAYGSSRPSTTDSLWRWLASRSAPSVVRSFAVLCGMSSTAFTTRGKQHERPMTTPRLDVPEGRRLEQDSDGLPDGVVFSVSMFPRARRSASRPHARTSVRFWRKASTTPPIRGQTEDGREVRDGSQPSSTSLPLRSPAPYSVRRSVMATFGLSPVGFEPREQVDFHRQPGRGSGHMATRSTGGTGGRWRASSGAGRRTCSGQGSA